MKRDLLAKPNQLIEIHGNINISQSKIYNIILANIHQELKKDKNKMNFIFDLEVLKEKAGVYGTNNKRLREYLSSLSDVKIEYRDNKDDWGGFNLISAYEKIGSKIEIEIPSKIRKALIENNYYTTLDLLQIKQLKGKHSITLYELALKYEKVKIPIYDIKEFRKITGTDKTKSYDDFHKLKIKVLNPAIEEINEKTDLKLFYKIKKNRRKITHIQFELEKNIIKNPSKTQNKNKDQLEKAISKAKKNLYLSKAWNKRADNKIKTILELQGRECAIDMLGRAYNGCQKEIEKTLVQYFNGILKNMTLEKEEAMEKSLKILKNKETSKLKTIIETREELVVNPIDEVVSSEMDCYRIYESLNGEAQQDILNQARKYYLNETGTPSFSPVHEKIFNMTKKSYINRILSA